MAFKIYTKTGDKGETGLFGGSRVPKSHLRIETYGTVDELNSFLGLLRDSIMEEDELRTVLKNIQEDLFTIGAILATDPSKDMKTMELKEDAVEMLEKKIDEWEAQLPALKNFILPGGHPLVSFAHIARCVCRRTERLAVALNMEEPVEPHILTYLNRLSDFLFVLARQLGKELGTEEVVWNPR